MAVNLDPYTKALAQARFHAQETRDGAYCAFWVAKDVRDFHVAEMLMHAALLAAEVSRIRALRPDLAAKADRAAERHVSQRAAAEIAESRAHG